MNRYAVVSSIPESLSRQIVLGHAGFLACLASLFLLFPSSGRCEDGNKAPPADSTTEKPGKDSEDSLLSMSLEELMNVKVTIVSRKEESVRNVASAVHVVTNDDIRRSGAQTIPDALRMVPGLQVAGLSASRWGITSRGFNDLFANKLLVLMDGRSVYTPLFSGIYWDVQDTLLEDVKQIEVVRGPGATVWGANAVNGVINVVTKKAEETQGGYVEAGVGTEERGFGAVRYGGKMGDDVRYRVYAKYFNRDELVDEESREGHDDWRMIRGGFRLDWTPTEDDEVTFQGDAYVGAAGETTTIPVLPSGASPFPVTSLTFNDDQELAGGNFLGRWKHTFPGGSETNLQFYYDRTERDLTVLGEIRDTFDFDFRHLWRANETHEVVWGAGFRSTSDDIDNSGALIYHPQNRTDYLWSAFVQDQVRILPDRLHLTFGSKFEINDYTGFEVQPSVRLLFAPRPEHSLWWAVSRAVRTPSRSNDDFRVNAAAFPGFGGGPPSVVSIFGDRDYASEELLAFEFGYRAQPLSWFSLDSAFFLNLYDNLHSNGDRTPFLDATPAPHTVLPLKAGNKADGETYGAELSVNFRPTSYWRLSAGYTYLQMQLHSDPTLRGMNAEAAEDVSPHHQVQLLSRLDLPHNLEFDISAYFMDRLPGPDIPPYTRLDVRLGWRPIKDLELSLIGQNLLDDRHPEFNSPFQAFAPTEQQRSMLFKISWRF